jgi:ribosome-associated translation inhibitor RaiA
MPRVFREGGAVEIHWVGLSDRDGADQAEIEARLELLAEGHDDLIDLRITGRKTRHHLHGGHEVRITCQARGSEIVAARTRPDLGLALNEALDAFEREVHRLRGYFHRNAVKEGLDFDRLEEADRVGLNVEPGREGPQATTVVAPPPREG